ncbi:MAG: polyribonucleotide nucleotidyltransferase [Chloroflexia bacterium]
MQVHRTETTVAGRKMTLETGRLAEQAQGAVLVTYGENVVLATVVGAYDVREGTDFLPLTVDYEEKMYAAGKIPGGFIKRESRPSEAAVLTSRLTDRPLRPLFPKGYYYEIQVMVTVLSVDMETDPNVLSIIGSSAALCISDIPFKGPVGAARVGHVNGEFVLNPTYEQLAQSRLDMMIAGNRDAVLMVEAGASELTEDQMLEAVKFGHAGLQSSIEIQEELIREAAVPKRPFEVPVPDTSDMDKLKAILGDRLRIAANNPDKVARESGTEEVRKEAVAAFAADAPEAEKAGAEAKAQKAFASILKAEVRNAILDKGIRPDGRGPTDIRQISVEVGVLPRTHGTGLFTRGQTQVLTICTLGTGDDEQKLDGLGVETKKRYIHHYNFPPFSTGETRRARGPSRRDIGHGHLAERSLVPVLPSDDDFPYVIRLVSETLASNGSSSMASVCGSTLAMLDAGVPLKASVAGIAMGLVTDPDGRHTVLTDIQGIEDNLGDMDFKVAGTAEGVTGLQMDIKTTGLSYEIMSEAFAQARDARIAILDKMNAVISKPRAEMSVYAPRIIKLQINPEKIGALIGPGGKMIRSITETTGCKIDVEDDGSVFVASTDGASARRAIQMIEGLTKEPEIGTIYLGKVVSIQPYGAFVQIMPGKDGLVRISELADYFVERVEDVVSIGDEINVMVIGVDRMGKISLSRRAVLTGQIPTPEEQERSRNEGRAGGAGGGGRDRAPRDGGGTEDDRPPRDPNRAPNYSDRAPARSSGSGYGDRGPARSGGGGYGDRGPSRSSGGGGYGDRDRGPSRGGGGGFGDRGPSRSSGGDRGPSRGNERGPNDSSSSDPGTNDRDRGPRW